MEVAKKYTDATKTEWSLYQSKPSKFIISDDETENVLTLVYDMKTDECVITSSAGTSTVKPTKDISSRDYMVEGGKK